MAGAILVITVGVVFLLNNLGVLDWNIWHSLWRLWPLLLIAAGLDLMFGRLRFGKVLALLLLLGVVVPILWALTSDPGPARTESLSQSLAGATSADVRLQIGVAHLKLNSHAERGTLLKGSAVLHGGAYIEQSFEHDGDRALFTLEERAHGMPLGLFSRRDPNWDLGLSRDVKLRLEIETGVGRAELDLRDLQLTELQVTTGVGQSILLLPRTGRLSARIHGGVGETIVRIPEGLAARIEAESGIGSVNVRGRFLRDGNTYRSPDFDSARDRVELEIEGGIGRIRVEGIGPDSPAEAGPAVTPEKAPEGSLSPVPEQAKPSTP